MRYQQKNIPSKHNIIILPSKYTAKPWRVLSVVFLFIGITGAVISWNISQAATSTTSGEDNFSPLLTTPLTGDTNSDSKVDALDLSKVLSNYSQQLSGPSNGDVNTDNVINALDLSTVLTNYGRTQSLGIVYGTDGNGNSSTAGCTIYVESSQAINSAISSAGSGSVLCVKASNRPTETVNANKSSLTIRAIGKTVIRNATIAGTNITLDGFTIVGGAFNSPAAGITYDGSGLSIRNNLINGKELLYGIFCDRAACGGTTIANNTITGLQSIGIYLGGGNGAIVEKNNIYDLVRTRPDYDVDAMRFFGTNHIIRYNYFHDINMEKSIKDSTGDTPHSDCFQTYQTFMDYSNLSGPIDVANITIENNYCLRVSRHCLIAENNRVATYQVRDVIFRNNICETYDSQSIHPKGVSGFTFDNNFIIGGFRYHVIAAVGGVNNLTNTGLKFRNNVLVRVKSSANFYTSGNSINEIRTNNIELTDTSLDPRDDTHYANKGALPSFTASDFADYKAYLQQHPIVDKGISGNTSTTSIDGNPRLKGTVIDIGPYEF